MTFPTLYKKTNTGAIQFWTVSSCEKQEELVPPDGGTTYTYGVIETIFGQVGTDKPQHTWDIIKEGKNIGKKNFTTASQQAEKEALARWEKQKKKGYVESIEGAEAGEIDSLIEGGIVPILAHKFSDHGHKINYPAYVQPKLDGIRCIAILKEGTCTLWSRTRKPITGVPHIVAFLERNFEGADMILDGELYNHEYKDNFEKIVSLVRQEEPGEGHKVVQYHVYDIVTDSDFHARTEHLDTLLFMGDNSILPLVEVQTCRVESEADVMSWFNTFKKQGYEGAIVRNANGKYVNKRSHDLLKVKEFDDAEFKITGIDEGRGKLAGHVGAFICSTQDGKEFMAKMSGETARLKDYFDNHSLWQGKKLTVQYQGLTGKEGVPRFPVGIAIRDYE